MRLVLIMTFVWFLLGVLGVVIGNDAVFVVGLVNSTVNSVGASIIKMVNKKEGK